MIVVTLGELTKYLDNLLDIRSIPEDKSNNGLQIEGKSCVNRIIGSVDACLQLYEEAAEQSGDFIIVHHGESWGDGFKYFTGPTARRFSTLFVNGISLYAAHLPLDAHRELGHNIMIASKLSVENVRSFAQYGNTDIGLYGKLPAALKPAALAQKLEVLLQTDCRIFDFLNPDISTVGIISGSGARAIDLCRELGIDCLVTGDCDHTHYHPIKESGVVVITAGHYRTEVPGIVAVLETLGSNFDVDCQFIDIPTGL